MLKAISPIHLQLTTENNEKIDRVVRVYAFFSAFSIMFLSDAFAFELTPTCCEMRLPLLNTAKVGMLKMLYLEAISLFWSTFTLTKLTLSENSFATSSTIGATALHGPHHGAQKSTKTGRLDFSTSLSQSPLAISFTWCFSASVLYVVFLISISYHLYFL